MLTIVHTFTCKPIQDFHLVFSLSLYMHLCQPSVWLMLQVVKSQVTTGNWTQGLWHTVPLPLPLSYWDLIFWLTLTHLDNWWHIPPIWVTFNYSKKNTWRIYSGNILIVGIYVGQSMSNVVKSQVFYRDSSLGPLAYCASALTTELSRPDLSYCNFNNNPLAWFCHCLLDITLHHPNYKRHKTYKCHVV